MFSEKWYLALDAFDDHVSAIFGVPKESPAGVIESDGHGDARDYSTESAPADVVSRDRDPSEEPTASGEQSASDESPAESPSDAARTVRARLHRAFAILRKRGFFARANWTCCQNCGWKAVPEGTEHVVFWNAQTDDYLRKHAECRLTWKGDGNEIADVLRRVGLAVEWDGTARMRIGVSLPKDELRNRAPTAVDSPTERCADANKRGEASPRDCAAPRGAS